MHISVGLNPNLLSGSGGGGVKPAPADAKRQLGSLGALGGTTKKVRKI